jgi:hypothetical protein
MCGELGRTANEELVMTLKAWILLFINLFIVRLTRRHVPEGP